MGTVELVVEEAPGDLDTQRLRREAAAILDRAILLVQARWGQGVDADGDLPGAGVLCVGLAIVLASRGTRRGARDLVWRAVATEARLPIELDDLGYRCFELATWNDAPGRRRDEVLVMLANARRWLG